MEKKISREDKGFIFLMYNMLMQAPLPALKLVRNCACATKRILGFSQPVFMKKSLVLARFQLQNNQIKMVKNTESAFTNK